MIAPAMVPVAASVLDFALAAIAAHAGAKMVGNDMSALQTFMTGHIFNPLGVHQSLCQTAIKAPPSRP